MAAADPHPLWRYLPQQRQRRRDRLRLHSRRCWSWLQGRRQRIGLILGVYSLSWCLPWLFGEPMITAAALLPLVLVPPLGWLVYRLVWREFHG